MTEWWKRYTAWEQRVKKEFQEKYPAWADGHVEICEDGSVFLGNMTWFAKGTVEPFSESQAVS